jgi:signal transduction histidine kinase/ActR/RegA family two-component response regulator
MRADSGRPITGYAVALVTVGAATLLRMSLQPVLGEQAPFAAYVVAVTFVAWYGGLGPALVSLVLGALSAAHWFLPPAGSLAIVDGASRVGLTFYTVLCLASALAIESMRRAGERAEALARDLRETEARMTAIVASATDAIITADRRGRIMLFNAAAEAMFGCAAADAVGGPLERFVPAAIAAAPARIASARRADGEEFPIEARVSHVDVGGEPLMTLIVRDVTDRRQAEREREASLWRERTARAQAETATRAKDEFLAVVSHELRTPLSPILAWASMLQRGMLDAGKTQRALVVIEQNAKAQAQLIDDLLDVSRIVSGRLRLDVRPIEPRSVIERALEVVRPGAEAKGVRLNATLDPRAGFVSGDGDRLQQVVWNLLSNAVKFTPRGGRAEVRLERVQSHVEIVVSDTGNGISPEFLPRLFDRFEQADVSSTRRHGGLGLGLAIVRHLVELHGGTVAAESPGEGEGATFRVRLPLLIAQRDAADVGRRHPVAGAGFLEDAGGRLDGVRVLVVDDEPDSNEVVRSVLLACGAEVETAASAAQALGLLDRWRPDVLVSDIGMPDEDGYALITRVRARADDGRIPAIALTAYARVEDRVKLLSAGFQLHVAKPLEPAELVAAVGTLSRSTRASG